MQDKGLDFKHKEVVNINNGKRLGYVQDVCADLETGTITSMMVARKNQKRTGYVVKEKYCYDVICKVEL